jgi:hypothetical protein
VVERSPPQQTTPPGSHATPVVEDDSRRSPDWIGKNGELQAWTAVPLGVLFVSIVFLGGVIGLGWKFYGSLIFIFMITTCIAYRRRMPLELLFSTIRAFSAGRSKRQGSNLTARTRRVRRDGGYDLRR